MLSSFQYFRAILYAIGHRQALEKGSISPEWVPSMLHKTRALPMASLCFVLIAVLEILYRVTEQSHGTRSDNNTLVIPIRYLPTAAAVAIGIIWKSVVWDIKTIMPWSVLSRGAWTQSSESLFLNYTHQIEILAVPTAVKKKHWAMLVALSTGFLCGAAVAATNSLTYMDLFAEVKESAAMRTTSRFDFNGTLVNPDGTLKIPMDHLGSTPYASVAVERLPGGRSASWSNGNYAFDSFAPVSQKHDLANASIESHVNAFPANMECHHLRVTYEKTDGDDINDPFILTADQKDVSLAGCSLPINWEIKSCYHHPQAWLNITDCSSAPNDQRILAFVAIPEAINSLNLCHDI